MRRKDTDIKTLHPEEYRDEVQYKKLSQHKIDMSTSELKPHSHVPKQEALITTRPSKLSQKLDYLCRLRFSPKQNTLF